VSAGGAQHVVHIAVEVFERALPVEILDDAPDRGAQPTVPGVVAGIHRWVGLDELGRDCRAGEDVVVVEIAAVQDLGRDRIEERLRQLGLAVVDQHADEAELGLLPGGVVEGVGAEFAV